MDISGINLPNAERQKDGLLGHSFPVPHENPQTSSETVMMTHTEGKDGVFVHASDIQLLNTQAVDLISAWRPNIVLAAGHPRYLASLTVRQRYLTWENGLRLAREVDTLILDHHLLRDESGLCWLKQPASASGRRLRCAADFMDRLRCLLEPRRVQLYKEMPISEG